MTGRLKDLIIIGGRNLYPTDIEQACGRPRALRPGAARPSRRSRRAKRVAIVLEMDAAGGVDLGGRIAAMRSAIARATGAQANAVALRPKTIAKTPSGKVQRRLCRERFLSRRLDVVAEWSLLDRA